MNFLDIAGQNARPKPNITTPKDRLDHYLEWAPRVLGYKVRVFVMTVPAFAAWHKYCQDNDMDYQGYKGIPIHVNKNEFKLKSTAILL